MNDHGDPTQHDFSGSIHTPQAAGEANTRAIGELIRDARQLSADDLEHIARYQREHNVRFGEAAIALGLASAEDVLYALSQQFQYAYGDEQRRQANPELVALVQPFGHQAEAFRAIRSQILLRTHSEDETQRRALAVVSSEPVRVLGNAANAYDLSQTQIALGGGRTVKLSDVATVKDAYSEIQSIAKVKGKQVVTFGMSRAKGASDVTVYDGAVEQMKKIEAENPGIKFIQLFNSVVYTKGQYKSSMAAMIEGALLAIVVVFLFLRRTAPTVAAGITVPLSISGTIGGAGSRSDPVPTRPPIFTKRATCLAWASMLPFQRSFTALKS